MEDAQVNVIVSLYLLCLLKLYVCPTHLVKPKKMFHSYQYLSVFDKYEDQPYNLFSKLTSVSPQPHLNHMEKNVLNSSIQNFHKRNCKTMSESKRKRRRKVYLNIILTV